MTQRYVPTDKDREIVKAMAGYGVPPADISIVIGVSLPTLRLYYQHDLDTAAIRANSAVAQSLFHMATKGQNVAAAIFWCKVRLRWHETLVIEDADKHVDVATLSDAALDERIRRLARVAAPGGTATAPDGAAPTR